MRRAALLYVAAAVVAVAAGLALYSSMGRKPAPAPPPTISVYSPAFSNGSYIPSQYTCDGADISPPLNWSGVPPGAKSLVVAVIDIDAPSGFFIHWVLYNIPPNTSSLPSGVPRGTATPYGLQATNDFGFSGYGGPCPPPGKPHRYIFYVLALNATIDLPGGSPASEVLSAARSHVIAYGELVGLYGR